MRFTWGHGIFLGIVLFMAFILSMVFKAHRQSFSLTAKDYYMKELSYQDQIEAQKNVQQLSDTLAVLHTLDEVILSYPFSEVQAKRVKGQVLFYRPNGMALDKHYLIKIGSDHRQHFLKSDLLQGQYILKISWQLDGQSYYIEQAIQVNK